MNKHTAGPWRIGYRDRTIGDLTIDIVSGSGPHALLFGDGTEEGDKETEANANLIATAPELLEYLQKIVNAIELSEEGWNNLGIYQEDIYEVLNKANGYI